MTYLDTSALAKWYLNESGSEDFSAWIQTQHDVNISSLTALEFRCLLARRKRRNEIPPEMESHLFAVFESDVHAGHLIQHPATDTQILAAIKLLERVFRIPLRSLDAIHLQITIDIGAQAIATADRAMANAARELGIDVFHFAA